MKKIMIGFLAGVLIASAGWYAYTWYLKSVDMVEVCGIFLGEAEFAEHLFSLANSQSPESRLKAERTAVNMVKTWLHLVDQGQKQYPITGIRQKCDKEYRIAQTLIEQWEKGRSNQVSDATSEPAPSATSSSHQD